MYLKYIQIINFRNLKTTRFKFLEGTNSIIGENDAGKSNTMTGIRILLDSDYYYNTKRLKETDFSFELEDWRGHWIIISAFFDKITSNDKKNEICSELIPANEDENFLASYIRCKDTSYGTVTLFIRPNKYIRTQLHNAKDISTFNTIRKEIKLADYEFFYTARSQADFTDPDVYKAIVGDLENGEYADPDNSDLSIIGVKLNILDVWSHISISFIDALRDVNIEMKKPKNPIRRIIDSIQTDINSSDLTKIKEQVKALNKSIMEVQQISNIGTKIAKKMDEIVGLVYTPEIALESRIKTDILSISKNIMIMTGKDYDINLLGLGHLNVLYMALKLVEFEYNKTNEILNIMLIEEPEAHVHTHIQKTLFNKFENSLEYTQIIMSTHSTQISEIADIDKINILKQENKHAIVMRPTNNLDSFGNVNLKLKTMSLSKCLERYLDAKRSVLLFSKGIILVEGDAEEIMLPSLVKQTLGVTLDELGIGLINIGSVAFEYIASIFSEDRIRKNCAIVTDLDTFLEGSKKSKQEAEKIGISRKEKLDKLFGMNKFVKAFYSKYTFEIEFFTLEENRKYFKTIVSENYTDKSTIERHSMNIDSDLKLQYDTILTVAEHIGKGWLATIAATKINFNTSLPRYLLKAINFAFESSINEEIIWKMIKYQIDNNKDKDEWNNLYEEFYKKNIYVYDDEFCKNFYSEKPNNILTKLLNKD